MQRLVRMSRPTFEFPAGPFFVLSNLGAYVKGDLIQMSTQGRPEARGQRG